MSLPDGWVRQYDPNYDHFFWVDTRSTPPRAIWVHPYEDEQFLAEHPDIRTRRTASDPDAPPSYDVATSTRATESVEKPGPSKQAEPEPDAATSAGPSSQISEHKRGVFSRLKDKAIGTKEEREEHRRVRAEQAALAEERARQARMRQLEEREAYMRAYGGYAPYRPSYPARPAYGPVGGDNAAVALLGGLLLGDIFGGGF